MKDVKEMTERLSDFASCVSSDSSEDDSKIDNVEENNGFQIFKGKQQKKRNKRKFKMTPDKDHFLKKPNLTSSCQSSA